MTTAAATYALSRISCISKYRHNALSVVCVSTAIGYLRYRSRSTLVLQVSILSRPFTLVPINSYGDDIDDATAAAASLGRDGNWVSPKLVEDLRPDLLQGPTMVALDGSGSAVFTNLRLAELASNHRHLV